MKVPIHHKNIKIKLTIGHDKQVANRQSVDSEQGKVGESCSRLYPAIAVKLRVCLVEL